MCFGADVVAGFANEALMSALREGESFDMSLEDSRRAGDWEEELLSIPIAAPKIVVGDVELSQNRNISEVKLAI